MNQMDVIQLDDYINKSGSELIARLTGVSENSRPALILSGDDVIGTLLAPEPSASELTRRLLDHVTPERLDDLLAHLSAKDSEVG